MPRNLYVFIETQLFVKLFIFVLYSIAGEKGLDDKTIHDRDLAWLLQCDGKVATNNRIDGIINSVIYWS